MPSLIDAIRGRRSVRKYSSRQVPSEILNEVLEAARWAPSAHNAQPWRFTVLSETEEKKILAEVMAEAWIRDLVKNQMPFERVKELAKISIERFTEAPTVIVACITLADMPK